MTEPADVRPDGRALRSANTRRAVAEAYLDLVQEGVTRPTAKLIAERARVSERAVFRHFQDLETLLAEAARLQIERVGRAVPPAAPAQGPVDERLEAFAERWCELNERVTPVRRVALLYEPFSEEVARRLGWIRGVRRNEIERTFGAELASLAAEERKEAVAALSAASSWATWNELRTRHQLATSAARRTVARSLTALLRYMGAP
ncbi:MAG: TetR/AcrR family transcriptional regulator [Deltaproteobacteria bacterium]|nr:TetR/AcrR family transcriptional regulator [Deltaproteobacteria bacterium]